jgi:hypothetical protein
LETNNAKATDNAKATIHRQAPQHDNKLHAQKARDVLRVNRLRKELLYQRSLKRKI